VSAAESTEPGRELVAGHVFCDAPRFSLGQLVATPGAIRMMERTGATADVLLRRHQSGDWGDLPPEDAAENEFAIGRELRILSSYGAPTGEDRLWVITEADRSVTTILQPEEY
jgi:hypothetical protein